MPDRPIVLLVGKGPPELGGIPSFLVSLTESDLAVDFDLRFVNLTPPAGSHGGRMSVANITNTVADAWRVGRAARGADVVHLHSALFPSVTLVRAGLLALGSRLAGAPVLVHAHGGRLDQWLTTPARRILARAALVPASMVVAVSRPNQTRLREAIERPVELLLNGIDTRRFHPHPEGGRRSEVPVVLYAGVLARRKGLFELLEASKRLRAAGVEHRVVLAGGPAADGTDELTALQQAAGDEVTFAGTLDADGVAEAYRGADVFCLPSWGDAMPLCVLEAMSSGLPVVATRVGQISEMVEDGTTGSLVEAGDVAGLTDALQRLLTDPDRCAAQGRAGRQRVEDEFDLRATVRTLSQRYTELAATRRSQRTSRHRVNRPGAG